MHSFKPFESEDFPGWYKVPDYHYLLANKEGQIFNIEKQRIETPFIDNGGYLRKSFKSKPTLFHRLICQTFYGPHPEDKRFVNHKDGNKQNNHYTNLEWVSGKENSLHAFRMGLSKGLRRVKLFDHHNKKEYFYDGFGEIFDNHHDIRRGTLERYLETRDGRLYKNRYEIKYVDDSTPWKDLNIVGLKSTGYKKSIDLLRIETGDIITVSSLAEAERITSIKKGSIWKMLMDNSTVTKNGFMFKWTMDSKPWGTPTEYHIRAIKILHRIFGKEEEFVSINSLIKKYKFLNRRKIASCLKDGNQVYSTAFLVKYKDSPDPWVIVTE
jgi:hypothetical protein